VGAIAAVSSSQQQSAAVCSSQQQFAAVSSSFFALSSSCGDHALFKAWENFQPKLLKFAHIIGLSFLNGFLCYHRYQYN